MNKFAVAYFFLGSVFAFADIKTYDLQPAFNEVIKVEFVPANTKRGEVLKGSLVDEEGKKYDIPDSCEPEGGSASLTDAYVVKGKEDYFVFTCAWSVQHSGLGLSGVQYETFVYADKNVASLKNKTSFSQVLSGYEGTQEDGAKSYAWYSTRAIASHKILELEVGEFTDSISLAHEIVLIRFRGGDYDAVKSYASAERLKQLISNSPIKSNVVAYNDIGFALGQSGEEKRAYDLLNNIESVFPDRMVLKLNIAEVLWSSDKEKSQVYYRKYIEMMRAAGKDKLIPKQAVYRAGIK